MKCHNLGTSLENNRLCKVQTCTFLITVQSVHPAAHSNQGVYSLQPQTVVLLSEPCRPALEAQSDAQPTCEPRRTWV